MSIKQGNNTIAGGVVCDNTPTSGSNNAVSSGGVYTALGGKADIDASNFDATGKSTIAGFAMPSDTWENLTYGGSSDFHTATANGYVVLSASTTPAGAAISIFVGDKDRINTADIKNNIINAIASRPVNGSTINLVIPIRKGQKFTINPFSGTYTIERYLFLYAEGEI